MLLLDPFFFQFPSLPKLEGGEFMSNKTILMRIFERLSCSLVISSWNIYNKRDKSDGPKFLKSLIICKVFETNSSFDVKSRTTRKVSFLFFEFLASISQVFTLAEGLGTGLSSYEFFSLLVITYLQFLWVMQCITFIYLYRPFMLYWCFS